MNKKEFLFKLKFEAKQRGLKNFKKLLTRYEKRFNLAKEAGFSEEEACEKFGNIDEIVEKFALENEEVKDSVDVEKETKDFAEFKNFTVDISLISDHVTISFVEGLENPVVDFNDANPDDYTIVSSNNCFKISFTPRAQFLTRWKSNHISIKIPDIVYKYFKISVVSGRYNLPDLRARKIDLKAVSGSYNIDSVYCDELSVNLVSGKVNLDSLDCRVLNINSVTGSVNIREGKWDRLNNHSITGHLNIDHSRKMQKER
ncbi:MAG: DUF4097 family beta strand repeat-containing protein [Bacilli bacterium]